MLNAVNVYITLLHCLTLCSSPWNVKMITAYVRLSLIMYVYALVTCEYDKITGIDKCDVEGKLLNVFVIVSVCCCLVLYKCWSVHICEWTTRDWTTRDCCCHCECVCCFVVEDILSNQ